MGEIGDIGTFSHLSKGKGQNIDIICNLFFAFMYAGRWFLNLMLTINHLNIAVTLFWNMLVCHCFDHDKIS